MNELIEHLSNWTLLKIVGGITLIISSAVSFFAYFIKEYLLNKWKTDYEKELVELRAKFDKNNSIVDNLTNTVSNIYLASNDKRLDYLENTWKSMLEIRHKMPDLVFVGYTILTKEEILNLPNDKNEKTQKDIESFNPKEFFNLQHSTLKNIMNFRPFIGEELWMIFYTYSAFLGRLTFLLQDGLAKGKIIYWIDDKNFINQIFQTVIKNKDLEILLGKDNFAFQNVLNYLEYKALDNINSQITGKRMSLESVQHAINLSEMTKTPLPNKG